MEDAVKERADRNSGQTSSAKDFHSELMMLRKRWRLKRTGASIIGDLTYRSGKKRYCCLQCCLQHYFLVVFDVPHLLISFAFGGLQSCQSTPVQWNSLTEIGSRPILMKRNSSISLVQGDT